MSGTTQTYVEYLIPGSFFAETETKKVSSRDITKLKVPDYAFGFQFFDVTSTVVGGEKLEGKAKNYSKRYIIAEEVLDQAGVKKKIKDNDILLRNMSNNGYKVVAQTRRGNIQPIDKDTVVINSKMQIIYGTEAVEKKTPAAKKAPAKPAFKDAALKKAITVSRPLQFKSAAPPKGVTEGKSKLTVDRPDDFAPKRRVHKP